jgi:peptidoglycan L-alanyl-D-glutamate endopeptidase CwlK
VKAALIEKSLTDAAMVCMAIATIRVETAAFKPINEKPWSGNSTSTAEADEFDLYDNRLGNGTRPEGKTFRGRGFVQLTGRDNYTTYGKMIGVDLLSDTELANEPTNAARLLAAFLSDHETRIRNALSSNNLAAARKAVNGGNTGLDVFKTAYTALFASLTA